MDPVKVVLLISMAIFCNETCSCFNGDCDSINGSCNCLPQFTGKQCDLKCIDPNCTSTCLCNDTVVCQTQNLCNSNNVTFSGGNNISIDSSNGTTTFINLNVVFTSLITKGNINILGNLSLTASSVTATDSQILVKGDLTISNASLLFSNSSFVVNGCIYLKNETQISVDLSANIKNKDNKVTLMTSSKNCLIKEGSVTFHYSNLGTCNEVLQQENTETLELIMKLSECSSSGSLNLFMVLYITSLILI